VTVQKVREVLDRGTLSMALTDRLAEEGYNSTDIAAALFELLAGPETPPEKELEEPRKKAAPSREEHLRHHLAQPPPRLARHATRRAHQAPDVKPASRHATSSASSKDSLGLPCSAPSGIIDILPRPILRPSPGNSIPRCPPRRPPPHAKPTPATSKSPRPNPRFTTGFQEAKRPEKSEQAK
jgi:hypothetical protein